MLFLIVYGTLGVCLTFLKEEKTDFFGLNLSERVLTYLVEETGRSLVDVEEDFTISVRVPDSVDRSIELIQPVSI